MQESRSNESNETNANRADKKFPSYDLNGSVRIYIEYNMHDI